MPRPREHGSTVARADPITFLAQRDMARIEANATSQILGVTRGLAVAAALGSEALPYGSLVAGYRIGEVTAWAVVGIWPAADTLRIAAARTSAMDDADQREGGLGYIRGLARPTVEALCARFGCAVAIANPDYLFVIGGLRPEVARACQAATEAGAVRAAPIAVHVASHTPRLARAVAPFQAAMHNVASRRPHLRLLTATDQRFVTNPAAAMPGLAAQVATTIEWTSIREALLERGVWRALEFGPGSAPTDMARGSRRATGTPAASTTSNRWRAPQAG